MSALWKQVRLRRLLGVLPIVIFLAAREPFGPTAAIVSGFSASVIVFLVNRGHAGPVLALSTFALVLAAIASIGALWMGDERIYFAGDPAWDFGMALVLIGSVVIRRPLADALTRELWPTGSARIHRGHGVFYIATLIVGTMYLFHGAVRLAFLVRADSIEQYIVLSRLVQWSTGLLLLVFVAWMIRRAAGDLTAEPEEHGEHADQRNGRA